ncbi:MAG: cytidylate kinase family protein [Candidatus Lokiarchaeota archaeon]|nr:cytidylate kinase family protein [Candidatus Lokiarchaeota archaeon]
MIIAISGLHGTGKSTIAKLLADKLDILYYSTGQAFRDLAKENNMSLEEYTSFVEKHPNIDKELDNKVAKMANEGSIIIDSQLGGHILKSIANFKIQLTCPLEVRIKRMAARDQASYKEKLKETTIREKSELERFKKLYDIDLSDKESTKEFFDLIIDTEHLTIEEIVQKILLELDQI